MIRNVLIVAIVLSVVGCGPSDAGNGPASTEAEPAAEPTAFDPLVRALERAEGVQQTIDEQAAARRRQIEEAER